MMIWARDSQSNSSLLSMPWLIPPTLMMPQDQPVGSKSPQSLTAISQYSPEPRHRHRWSRTRRHPHRRWAAHPRIEIRKHRGTLNSRGISGKDVTVVLMPMLWYGLGHVGAVYHAGTIRVAQATSNRYVGIKGTREGIRGNIPACHS